MSHDRCACGCARLADLPFAVQLAGVWWRHECLNAMLAELLSWRAAPPEVVGCRVAWLLDNGAIRIARATVGPLPFGAENE